MENNQNEKSYTPSLPYCTKFVSQVHNGNDNDKLCKQENRDEHVISSLCFDKLNRRSENR